MKKEDTMKKEKRVVKPTLVVQRKDKFGHDVFECGSREDAEKLRRAFSNPRGVVVKGPGEKEKRCLVEPEKPYENSICHKIEKMVKKKVKKKLEER